jgi:hypothetical protein
MCIQGSGSPFILTRTKKECNMAVEAMTEKPVVYYLEDGTEISNDPRWLYQQQAEAMDAQQKAMLGANAQTDEFEQADYTTWSAAQLKEELKKRQDAGREFDTAGVTKKGQVIDLLKADDEAAAAEQQS